LRSLKCASLNQPPSLEPLSEEYSPQLAPPVST
jgi:hypothetical protein